MNTKYTPGPWKNDQYGVITGGPDFATSIAEAGKHNRITQETSCANARLITAAPDLLEAAQLIIAAYRNKKGMCAHDLAKLSQAVNKTSRGYL